MQELVITYDWRREKMHCPLCEGGQDIYLDWYEVDEHLLDGHGLSQSGWAVDYASLRFTPALPRNVFFMGDGEGGLWVVRFVSIGT